MSDLLARGMIEQARQLAALRTENERLRAEIELLTRQLDYWREKEAADPLPFAEEADDDEQS